MRSRSPSAPRGRNVVLDKRSAPPPSPTTASPSPRTSSSRPFENIGAQLAKEIASKTNDIAGDGTTTATVLGQAIVHEGLKNVAAGANPMALKRGIEPAPAKVVETPQEERHQGHRARADGAGRRDLREQRRAVGDLIGEVMEKVGKDGVITVEESRGIETEVEYVEGMAFDRGYISPYFVTNPERMEAVIEDPYILITDKKLSSVNDILPWLEKQLQVQEPRHHREDVDGEALATLAVNKLRGTINVVAVKAPASATAARRTSATSPPSPAAGDQRGARPHARQRRIADLGRARRVVITKEETTIIEGKGTKKDIDDRIKPDPRQLERSHERLGPREAQERLGKLAG
jgi:chaperonin GroEL